MEQEIILNWPEWTIIILWVIGSMGNLVMHGKPKEVNYNFVTHAMNVAIMTFVLYFGGFWT